MKFLVLVLSFVAMSASAAEIQCSGKSTQGEESIQFSKSEDGNTITLRKSISNVFSFQDYRLVVSGPKKVYTKAASFGLPAPATAFPAAIATSKSKSTQFNMIEIGTEQYFFACDGQNPYL